MPAGLTNPALGYASFCVVKFAGYALAARYISRAYGRPDIGALRVGATRTLIGMAAGAAYFGIWMAAQKSYGRPPSTAFHAFPFLYLAGLLPVAHCRVVAPDLDFLRPAARAARERLAHGRPGHGLVLRSRRAGNRGVLRHRRILGLLSFSTAGVFGAGPRGSAAR